MKYLADIEMNTGRQPEIDMTKAVCILAMIEVHCFQEFMQESSGFLTTFVCNIAGLVGAATFMICMGVGMRYSNHQDEKSCFFRGIVLLTVSQFLNILRAGIPGLAAFYATGNLLFVSFILDTFQSDILTFAGLAFIFMAFLKKLKLRDGWILAIGLVMNSLSMAIFYFIKVPDEFWMRRFLNLFITTDDNLFPLGSHFLFVAVGYMIGGIYPCIVDKRRLANLVLLICVPAVIIYMILRMTVPFPLMPEYDLPSEPSLGTDVLASCANAFIIIAACCHVYHLIGKKVPVFMDHLSKNINCYYCISDVLLGSVMVILLATNSIFQNQCVVFLIGILLTAVCYILIELNKKYIHFTLKGLEGKTRIAVYTAIWIVSLSSALYGLSLVEDPGKISSFIAG